MGMTIYAQNGYREATSEETSSFVQKMSASSREMKSLTAEFEQRNRITGLSDEILSTGVIVYRQEGDYLSWEYLSPIKSKFTIEDGKITMESANKAAPVNSNFGRMARQISTIMLTAINGDGFQDSDMFSVKYMISPKGDLMVSMTPKDKKISKMFSSIDLYLDRKDYTANTVALTTIPGDVITLTFKNKMINTL